MNYSDWKKNTHMSLETRADSNFQNTKIFSSSLLWSSLSFLGKTFLIFSLRETYKTQFACYIVTTSRNYEKKISQVMIRENIQKVLPRF